MTSFEKIERLRAEKGWSGAELMRQIGLTRGVYTQWKQGLQKPNAENLKRIADVFDVPVSSLNDDAVIMTINSPVSEEDLIAAFYSNEPDLSADDINELWADAKDYIYFKKEQRKKRGK